MKVHNKTFYAIQQENGKFLTENEEKYREATGTLLEAYLWSHDEVVKSKGLILFPGEKLVAVMLTPSEVGSQLTNESFEKGEVALET